MSDPFARAWNRTDMYAAAVVGLAQIFNRDDDAFELLDAIEPGTHYDFGGGIDSPHTIVSITNRYVFVSISGTQGWEQWLLNILGSFQVPAPSLTGLVSAFFEFAAGIIFGLMDSTIRPSLASKRLVLMGHSLGGAVAQLLGDFYRNSVGAGMTVYTLGCPRVGDPSWASSAIGGFVFRCETTDDPIVAVPPSVWGGVNTIPPMPGPLSVVNYEHAGIAQTVDASGNLTSGSNPVPFSQVLQAFITRSAPTHYAQVYAERLRLKLPAELTPANTGYQSPSLFDAMFKDIDPASFPFLDLSLEGASGMKRFTLFFNIGTRAGYTEDFWADVSGATYTSLIAGYLDKRLDLCASEVVFKYARISDVPATRKVSWRSASDFVNTTGSFSAAAMAAPEQALDLRLIMTDNSPGRIFVHGFPRTQFDGENYTPTPAFAGKLDNFKALLKSGQYLFESLQNPHTPADRIPITAIAPQSPRGCVITPGEVVSVSVGDTVQIGGEGARILGLNGRKKVIRVAPGGATFTIGGAEPVGTPADLAAGCYFYTCQFQYLAPLFGGVVSLTTHKVGRPFGVRPGRRSNTIPLRQ